MMTLLTRPFPNSCTSTYIVPSHCLRSLHFFSLGRKESPTNIQVHYLPHANKKLTKRILKLWLIERDKPVEGNYGIDSLVLRKLVRTP
jgi:hypothetical protein